MDALPVAGWVDERTLPKIHDLDTEIVVYCENADRDETDKGDLRQATDADARAESAYDGRRRVSTPHGIDVAREDGVA